MSGSRQRRFRPPYAMVEIDLARPPEPVALTDEQNGAHVLARFHGRPVGRFWVERGETRAEIPAERMRRLAMSSCRGAVARGLRDAFGAAHAPSPAPVPSLTIAVCTRDRAAFLARCLDAIGRVRASCGEGKERIALMVVDNAPTNDETRQVVARHAGVHYVVEPVPGLDLARNRALAETRTELIAYIDDDAVVDSGWLDALAEAVRMSPRAAAFTGPVLPLCLETEAQLRFERAGGFGEEIVFNVFDRKGPTDRMHPLNAGRMGTGANMAFSVAALRRIGGFDEALDTGPPLPGGGDLDAFLRIVAGGGRLVYSPGQVVFHEHRRDMESLRRQHASWGLAVAVLLRKNAREDRRGRARRVEYTLWWLRRLGRRFARSLVGRDAYPPSFLLAEALGALKGTFGEYDRSRLRIATRKRSAVP